MATATLTPHHLARLADVADPDSPTSPGALWLTTVAACVDDVTTPDDVTETADSLVPVYTHERMAVLVDLAAYREDLADAGLTTTDDMVSMAGVALYLVAARLLSALVSEEVAA